MTEPGQVGGSSPESARNLDDVALASAAAAGDARATAALIERLRVIPRVLHAKNRRCGAPLSREDLDDLAQAAFATVWRRLATFRGDAAIESFACQVALYHWLNAVRKKRVDLLGDHDSRLEAAAPSALDASERDLLRDAVGQLDDAQAQVIELKLYQGLTFEEIEAQLSISSNTLKTRYYRGLERLRTLLRGKSLERPA